MAADRHRHDLFLNSRLLARPVMENVWTSKALIASILLDRRVEPRIGFVDHVPGGLPKEMLSTFAYISAVDQVLAHVRGQNLDDEEADRLRCSVNDAHYRLMSLRPWPDLSEEERADSHLGTYELCRLSIILYSNAILFPVPVASGWHVELLGQLRVLLDTTRLLFWPEDVSSLAIWSLCLASIAAFATKHRVYFEQTLRDLLIERALVRWRDVTAILKQFLWSDAACSQGLLVLRERLQLPEDASMARDA